MQLFQSLLRCVKLWAKRRGVYGHVRHIWHHFTSFYAVVFIAYSASNLLWSNHSYFDLQLLGYFGGVHLAVLAAFVCQRHPNASLSALMSIFFKTFAFWPWPTPVFLNGRVVPTVFPTDVRFLMPIQLPCSPNQFCHCNITRSTFYRIKGELVRGHAIIEVCFWLTFRNFAWFIHFLASFLCCWHKVIATKDYFFIFCWQKSSKRLQVCYSFFLFSHFWNYVSHCRIFWGLILVGVAYLILFLMRRHMRCLWKYASHLLTMIAWDNGRDGWNLVFALFL